jgi:hypothetical protein
MTYDHWKATNPADEELGPECALCLGPIAEAAEGLNTCPHCGAVALVVREGVIGSRKEEEDA